MKKKRSPISLGLTACGLIITACIIYSQLPLNSNQSQYAEMLFINGDIVTINPEQPTAEAVAVSQGKIIAVGSQTELAVFLGPDTDTIDLKQQTLLPGFIEPHTHPVASALLSELLDLSGFTNPTPEAVFARLQEAADNTEPGEWIVAFGLDPLLTKGLIPPDRHKLDTIAPNNPVFILSQVMHTAYVNSLALQRSEVSLNTPDPDGGHFERDAQGQLSGIVHEAAISAVKPSTDVGFVKKIQQALAARTALIGQYQDYANAGYTTIGIPGPVAMFDGYLKLLEHVASSNSSPLRSYVYPMADEIEKTDYYPGYTNGLFNVIGVKIYLDGSPWTGAMASKEPYLSNNFTDNILKIKKGSRGILKQSPEKLLQQVEKFHNAGWQIAVHTHGERAHDLILDTLAKVQQSSTVSGRRHRLEHLGLITKNNLERAAKLGVTPSFFIDHIYYFGDAIETKLLGLERAQRFMPLAWAAQYHERVSIHTDNPATPLGPMRALRTAVTRRPMHSDKALNVNQQMTVDNALEAITIDAAWQMHAEDKIGSIEVGKQADFTLLSANPHKVDPIDWAAIKPMATWVAGEQTSNQQPD